MYSEERRDICHLLNISKGDLGISREFLRKESPDIRAGISLPQFVLLLLLCFHYIFDYNFERGKCKQKTKTATRRSIFKKKKVKGNKRKEMSICSYQEQRQSNIFSECSHAPVKKHFLPQKEGRVGTHTSRSML